MLSARWIAILALAENPASRVRGKSKMADQSRPDESLRNGSRVSPLGFDLKIAGRLGLADTAEPSRQGRGVGSA